MSRPPISSKRLTPTLTLSEFHDGFWLYDTTRGMNLSMRAKTAEAAFVEALTYYQQRLHLVEMEHRVMRAHVDKFVALFVDAPDWD
jgi:hypothetical protein